MMNLCSKCYRDSKMREEQAATAIAAVEKSLTSVPPLFLSPPKVGVVALKDREECVPVALAESSSTEKAVDVAPPPTKPANQCGICKRKVGVIGFKCRCGSTFCGSHRYPEKHAYTFDFKGAGRDAIAKANPVVKLIRLIGSEDEGERESDKLKRSLGYHTV